MAASMISTSTAAGMSIRTVPRCWSLRSTTDGLAGDVVAERIDQLAVGRGYVEGVAEAADEGKRERRHRIGHGEGDPIAPAEGIGRVGTVDRCPIRVAAVGAHGVARRCVSPKASVLGTRGLDVRACG